VNAVKRVNGRHADQPRRQSTVEAGALAVRVNQIGARIANDPLNSSERHRERLDLVDGNLDELDAERMEVRGEPLVPWARNRHAELVRRKMTNKIEDLARAAARRRRGEELQDANHSNIVTFAGTKRG
jgi:hypothetical protein